MANITEFNSNGRLKEDDLYIGTWFPFLDDDDDDDDGGYGADEKSLWSSGHCEQTSVDSRFLDVGKRSNSIHQQHPMIVVPNAREYSRAGYDELLESGPNSASSWSASDVCSVDSTEPRSPRPIVGRRFDWRCAPPAEERLPSTVWNDVRGPRGNRVDCVTEVARAHQPCCVLCRTNGEPRTMYQSHSLKDVAGMVTCPVLFGYVCPYCGATGHKAHTIRYCPSAPPGVSVIKSLKTPRDSAGHRRPH